MEEKSAPPFALPGPAQDDILDVETDPLVVPEEEEIEKETNAISSSSSTVCFWLQIYKPPRHLVLDRSQLQVLDDLKGIICLSTEPAGAEAARTSSPANKSPIIVVSSPPPWRASHVPSWHGIASQCR
jgi:hypothetical protein